MDRGAYAEMSDVRCEALPELLDPAGRRQKQAPEAHDALPILPGERPGGRAPGGAVKHRGTEMVARGAGVLLGLALVALGAYRLRDPR